MSAPTRQQELFAHALALPASERGAFLDSACIDDSKLAQTIATLRRTAQELSAAAPGATPQTITELLRAALARDTERTIERYKVGRTLGEGGGGVVYEAEQQTPVHRRVALKIIKPGTDTAAAIARFEAERQVLAMMEHPNIARVFDAGATEQGRLYFAMELVEGTRLTEYCDAAAASVETRLELFVAVCHAVQHAHQKGIIHRDLKPSNILVTIVDGRPVPKVIDFGIAKAMHGRLTEQTMLTRAGQFIGTPAYMSPEQAEWAAPDVDTRSDVYSLGVVLHELLVGAPPLNPALLERLLPEALQRTLRESPRLAASSAVLALSAADRAAVARRRTTTPALLVRALRGDLDCIVAKALAPDRGHRYQTVNDLALELARHRRHEPVLARPPGAWYQFSRFVRRHRTTALAAGAVAAALLIGTFVSTALAIRATRAEREQVRLLTLAEEARHRESGQRVRAEAGEATARAEALHSAQVGTFLKDMLDGVGPSIAKGRDTTLLREILDRTVERIDRELKDQPAVEAELRQIIGRLYYTELNRNGAAITMLQRAADLQKQLHPGKADPVVVAVLKDLATARIYAGDVFGAEPVYGEIVTQQRALGGPNDPALASALSVWASALINTGEVERAEAAAREAIEIFSRQSDKGEPAIARPLTELARALYLQSEPQGAAPFEQQALEIARRKDDPAHQKVAAAVLSRLSEMAADRADYARQAALDRELVTVSRKLGGEDPQYAWTLCFYGWSLFQARDFQQSLATFSEAVPLYRRLLGDYYTTHIACGLRGLGLSRLYGGDTAGAVAALRETRQVQEKAGTTGSQYNWTLASLAMALVYDGQRAEATGIMDALIQTAARENPDALTNVQTTLTTANEAWWTITMSLGGEATTRAILAEYRATRGPDDGRVADAHSTLGAQLYSREAYAEAERQFRAALALREKLLRPGDRAIAQTKFSLGATLWRLGRPAEAEPFVRAALESDRSDKPSPDVALLWATTIHGRIQFELGDLAAAEATFRDAIALAPKLETATAEDRAEAHEAMGILRLRQGQFAAADQEFDRAYRESLRRALKYGWFRDWGLQPRIVEYRVQLYREWDKTSPGQLAHADKWCRMLPDLRAVEAARKLVFPAPPAEQRER